MKKLNFTTVVLGFACGVLSAYPIWNEQKQGLEDTIPSHGNTKDVKSYNNMNNKISYNDLKDKDLLEQLVKDENMQQNLRNSVRNLDGDCMNFLGKVQGLNHLLDTVTVSGKLAKILGYEKISAPTAIYIYQIMFSEKGEEVGKGYDEYVKGMISDPFVTSN